MRGNTLGSVPVVLRPSAVCPHTAVASEPAYVVGTATIGRPSSRASSFASPIAEPADRDDRVGPGLAQGALSTGDAGDRQVLADPEMRCHDCG